MRKVEVDKCCPMAESVRELKILRLDVKVAEGGDESG